jgi:hypothetical protein
VPADAPDVRFDRAESDLQPRPPSEDSSARPAERQTPTAVRIDASPLGWV